jgi:tetratricopeptide (TPR) repeat protein
LYNLAGEEDKSYYEKTVKLLEDAIARGTKRVDAFYILSGAYGQLGNAEKVKELAKSGIALDPTYGYASYLFGGVYYDMKDFSSAARYFQEAIDKKYANDDSYKMLADAYIGMNDFPNAISAYEQLVKFKPGDPQLEANLLMLYINGNRPEKAREKGDEIKKKYPKTEKQIDQLLNKLPK